MTDNVVVRGVFYIAVVTAALFLANQLIGGGEFVSDFKRSLLGGIIGGGMLGAYLPLREKIRSEIKRRGEAAPNTSTPETASNGKPSEQ